MWRHTSSTQMPNMTVSCGAVWSIIWPMIGKYSSVLFVKSRSAGSPANPSGALSELSTPQTLPS